MNTRFLTLATLALFTSAPLAMADGSAPPVPKETSKEAPAPPVKEEDYAKTLVGTWRQEIKEGPINGYSTTTYFADGTATSSAEIDSGGKKISVSSKAKWTVEKNKLTAEIVESSMPQMIPAGTKVTQTIVSLSENEIRYTQSGKEITEKRVKPETEKAAPAK